MKPTRVERMRRHAHPRSVTVRRAARPCSTCGRTGTCADCCCGGSDHVTGRKSHCTICGHATTETRTG